MKTLTLIISVLFIAAILYVFFKPPKEVTLKDISSEVYQLQSATETATEENSPIDSSATLGDGVKAGAGDVAVAVAVAAAGKGNEKVLADYYIIVQSSRNPTLAKQKAEKLRTDFNMNFMVLPPSSEGYYRISCGKYSTLEEAKSAIKSLRTKIRSDLWILPAKK